LVFLALAVRHIDDFLYFFSFSLGFLLFYNYLDLVIHPSLVFSRQFIPGCVLALADGRGRLCVVARFEHVSESASFERNTEGARSSTNEQSGCRAQLYARRVSLHGRVSSAIYVYQQPSALLPKMRKVGLDDFSTVRSPHALCNVTNNKRWILLATTFVDRDDNSALRKHRIARASAESQRAPTSSSSRRRLQFSDDCA